MRSTTVSDAVHRLEARDPALHGHGRAQKHLRAILVNLSPDKAAEANNQEDTLPHQLAARLGVPETMPSAYRMLRMPCAGYLRSRF
jgi:hypothetical protein